MADETGLAAAGESAADLVIRGVAVVDPRDGSITSNQDVLIAGDRIVAVRPAGNGTEGLPASALIVEAAGKYLVPGFSDMHAHMHSSPIGGGDTSGTFELMVAYGVTGFRQ